LKKSLLRRWFLNKDQGWNVKFSWLLNWLYDTEKFGNEDETISSVLGKLQPAAKAERFRSAVNWFFLRFFGEVDHCANNIEADEGE
jgi:hypothetical protein